MTKIERAREFSHAAHDSIGQKRKYGVPPRPYWVHTDEVAETLSAVGETEDVVCAGHLHDVLEDVFPKNSAYSLRTIENEFGAVVAQLVLELTDVYTKADYPDKNRKERHALEDVRRSKISPHAASVKLADILSNSRDISEHDPDFAVTYLDEVSKLIPLLKHGNPVLRQAAAEQVHGLIYDRIIGDRGRELGECCGNGCVDCLWWSRPQLQIKGGRVV